MMQESDLVQRLALAYGERVVMEQFGRKIGALEASSCEHERGLVPTLRQLRSLYALTRVQARRRRDPPPRPAAAAARRRTPPPPHAARPGRV